MSKAYSNLAHVPYTVAITVIGTGLHLLHVPVSFIAATGGLIFCITREEAQREYQIMEEKHILRASLKAIQAWAVWHWNRHSKLETLWAVLAGYGAALGLHLTLGL